MNCFDICSQMVKGLIQFYFKTSHLPKKLYAKFDPFEAKGLFIFRSVLMANKFKQIYRDPNRVRIPNFKHKLVYSFSKTQGLNTL
jgi:hypothetical protein